MVQNSRLTIPHVITSPAFNVTLTRSVSSLKTIYLTFMNSTTGKESYDLTFAGADSAANMLDLEIHVGSKRVPVHGNMKTVPDYWWSLLSSTGQHGSVFHSNKIGPTNYLNDHFIVAVSLQKLQSEDGHPLFANESTKMGSLISVSGKNVAAGISMIYVTLEYDSLVQLEESGTTLLE